MAKEARKPKINVQAPQVEAPQAPTPAPQSQGPTAAPIKLSAASRVMSIVPRVVESAVEAAHSALQALAVSSAKYAQNIREGRQAQVESLLTMQGDIELCLLARAAGARTLKNADIDRILIENGVREPRVLRSKGDEFIIGSKSGASRFIAMAAFENEKLWTEKNADALRYIKAHGIEFEKNQGTFKTPYEALKAGLPHTAVHDVWARMIRQLNQQVAPSPEVTKTERLNKQVLNLPADQRAAIMAAISASLTQVGKTEATQG